MENEIKNNFEIGEYEKKIIESILLKAGKLKENYSSKAAVIDFETVYAILNDEEINFCKKMMSLNPKDYGFKAEHLGIKELAEDLVEINNQKFTRDGKEEIISTQFMPKSVYGAYVELKEACSKDISRELLVDSAYRSPAYQFYLFLFYLKFYEWDLNKTASRVALPGYSEHGDPQTAIDFITVDGIPNDAEPYKFAETPEYDWLLKNAGKFGFVMTYPKDNKLGVMFEPWHWRYLSKK